MRLHSDTITPADIYAAATTATTTAGHGAVYVDSLTSHGSRSRRQAWNVKLVGDGTHSRRRNASNEDYAATWDSWGWFFAHLFTVDPRMTVPHVYADADQFHERTHGAYARNLTSA